MIIQYLQRSIWQKVKKLYTRVAHICSEKNALLRFKYVECKLLRVIYQQISIYLCNYGLHGGLG